MNMSNIQSFNVGTVCPCNNDTDVEGAMNIAPRAIVCSCTCGNEGFCSCNCTPTNNVGVSRDTTVFPRAIVCSCTCNREGFCSCDCTPTNEIGRTSNV